MTKSEGEHIVTNEQVEEQADPYAPENIGVLHFIMQARIYDALMALLTHFDEGAAKDLLEVHASAALVGAAPAFDGNFITDLINTPTQENQGPV